MTRERVVNSTVGLIRQEGLLSASPVRITQRTGMSWGAVQHHFGSKEELLKHIVLLSRDQFHDAVMAPDYSGRDLQERISLYVESAWAHYQSDTFLAAVEITFSHRNNGHLVGEDVAGDSGRTGMLTRQLVERVFAGVGVMIDRAVEATGYMHCVLTGLAYQKILNESEYHEKRQLRFCKDAMLNIVLGRVAGNETSLP